MDPRFARKGNNADWESSFTHILQRTRQNLDKISSKPGSQSYPSGHSYTRAIVNEPTNAPRRGSSPLRHSPRITYEANENSSTENINRAHDMASLKQSELEEEKVANMEQALLKKQDSLEEELRQENALLKERILATERTGEQCVTSTESHTHEIKELQRIYANQALQLSRQNSMLEGINQELDSRRSQISKMDSWIRQEEIWRHDIEDQLNVLNKRVKSVERTTKDNKDSASESSLKMDSLEQLLHSNSAMSAAWTTKTEGFMRRVEKQRQATNALAREAAAEDDDDEEGEEGSDRVAGRDSSPVRKSSRRGAGRAQTIVEQVDPEEIFMSPPSLMYKQGILREVEVLLGSLENRVSKQARADYQADLAESTRHMRIEIQNYLYRMSADSGLAPPSFGSGGDTNSSIDEGRPAFSLSQQSPPRRESAATTTYGKVALNQQVDAMHYRLEDMCSAMAVVKEDAENNHSSLQHTMHSLENRLDEINITNQANVGSIQNRSAHIEEIVRSFEVQFYKLISDSKEDVLNKIRDSTMGANDDRSALDRRLAIIENIISTFSEKNKVSSDAIDAYFASSADIKKFDMNCVKMEGMQVELKHVREEARSLSATLTRFTSQTPRMDDILEMRERLSNVEPLAPQVSSLQSAFSESKDTSTLLKQLIKSLEEKCSKADDGIAAINTTISDSINPSVAKLGHELSVLDADVARLSSALNGLKDTVQTQATANADKWEGYKRNIGEKLAQQQDSTKLSMQNYNLQLIELSKRMETLSTTIAQNNSTVNKSILDSAHQLDTKLQDLLVQNINNLQTESNAQYVTTNGNITLLKDDLVKLVQSELQHTSQIQHEHIELLSRIGQIEEQTSQIEQTMSIHHELHSESSKQRYDDIYNRISNVEGEQQSLQQSYIQQQKQHAVNFQDVQRQLVEAAPSRAHRRMSSFSQMDGNIIGENSPAPGSALASKPKPKAVSPARGVVSTGRSSGGGDNMYNGRRMSTFAQMTGDSSSASESAEPPRAKSPARTQHPNPNLPPTPNRTMALAQTPSPKTDNRKKTETPIASPAPRASILKKTTPSVSPSASKKTTPSVSPSASKKTTPSVSPSSSSKSLAGLFQPMDSDNADEGTVPAEVAPAPKRRSTTRGHSSDDRRASRRGTEYYDPDSHHSDASSISETDSDFDSGDDGAEAEDEPVRKTSISFSNSVEYADSNNASSAPPTPMFSPTATDGGSKSTNNQRRGTVYFDAEASEAASAEDAAEEEEAPAPSTPMFSPAHDTGSNAYFDGVREGDDSIMSIPSLDDSVAPSKAPATPMFSPAHEAGSTSDNRRGTVYFDADAPEPNPSADLSTLSQEDRDLVASISGSAAQVQVQEQEQEQELTSDPPTAAEQEQELTSDPPTAGPGNEKDADADAATTAAVNNAVMLGELGKVLEKRNSGSNMQMQADSATLSPPPAGNDISDVDLSDFETPAKSSGDVSDSGTGTDTSSKLSIKERLKLRANKNKKK